MFNIFLYFITLSIMLYTYIYRHLHVNILAYLFSSLTAKPSYLPKKKKKKKKKPIETD